MPAIPLPVALEEKLDDVAAEVRRLRVLRGASWFAAVTFSVPLVAVGLDVIFDLSGLVRGLLLVGWLLTAALLGWLLVIRRLRGDIPPRELAAAIEREFPNLAERLSTLVELSEKADPGNGSKGMIKLLAQETEKRAKKMDFGKVAPTGFSLRLAGFAVLVGLLALTPLFAFRGATERVRRLVLPWYTPAVEVSYTLNVTSGNPVVKRGEAVTLSAYLERTKPDGDLPTAATLVYRVVGQPEERRLPMSGDDKAAFTVTRPKVETEFEYRVECGELKSEWFGVSVVDPVEVDEAKSKITIKHPKYTGLPDAEQKWGQVKALQHSTAEFEVRLTREPADVHAEWRAGDIKADQGGIDFTRALAFSDDRRTVKLQVPIPANGTVKFTLFAEKKVPTNVPVAVEADPDQPPKFMPAPVGMPDSLREVKKDAQLPLEITVTDDVAVGDVYFDYAPFNENAPFQSEKLAIKGGGPSASGKVVVSLAGKAALGDTIRIRLRATDNRSMPELGLTPNEATYPDKGWAMVRVVENARPLAEQDILSQQEGLKKKLDEAAAKVDEAKRKTDELKKAAEGKPMLSAAQARDAADAREQAQQAARVLEDAAADAGRTPDLAPLAEGARKVAAEPLATAEDELRKAGTDPKPDARDDSLKSAQSSLDSAAKQIKKLKQQNDDLAAARLNRSKLRELAEEERKLAEDAKKADPEKQKELAEKQKELSEQFKKLQEESDALKKAHEKAEKQRGDELGQQLADAAERQRELDAAIEKSQDAARREQLGEQQKRQQELNKQAKKFGEKNDKADVPLDPKPFDKAEGLLEKQKPADAMTEQEKAARELDRLAEEMAKRAKDRGDAKAAAEQLKRWQEDLNRRTADAARNNPNGVPQTDKDKLAAEQKAIEKATERLKLPPKSDDLEKLRNDAKSGAASASEQLQKSPADAADAQKKAADALSQLAEKTPSNQQRRNAAKKELDNLRKEQEQLAEEAKKAADAAKGNPDAAATRDELAKKLKEQADKQDELQKKLRDLDTPGSEHRRDKAADTARNAADDLKGGLPQDIPASQEQAKRQMDRLGESLDGKTPADEKASELARLQRDLTKNLDKAKTPEELQRLQRQQQDLSREVQKLKAPDAPGQLADAQEAAKAADKAAQKPMPDVDELKKKGEVAADALDKLSERLGGESPEQRVERLAKNRQAEAEKAKQAEGSRSDLTRSRDAQKQIERDLADLNDTRTGEAQAAKKQLQDALEKLNKTGEPDKAADAQKKAADAARKLADAVKKNGDRAAADKLPDPANNDPADPNDPGNALPTRKDAEKARDLAEQQRQLRDDVARAAEKQNKGNTPKPADGDPLGDLAKEQADVAKQAGELADKAKNEGDPAGDSAGGGAKAADKAANQMKAGDPSEAKKAGEEAAEKLRSAAKAAQNPDLKAKADELAKKQEGLNKKAGEADASAAATRQQNRQGELKAEADKLADKAEQAAQEAGKDSPAAKNLGDAADAARNAGKQMEQADRSGKNGKPSDAAKARQQAERNLDDAARAARGNNKQPDPNAKPDPSARPVDDAVKDAAKEMQKAEDGLKKGDGQKASDAAGKAADDLEKAADELAKGQQGQGQGQGQSPAQGDGQAKDVKPSDGKGGKPGNGGGVSGEVPSIVVENLGKSWGELPGDVKSKITQELKAKYGDDYARIIKLYFEQLAERK